MSQHTGSWGEYYHRIASGMSLYRETNRRLAELAELRPGMTVVDLACGSGLTSLAALDQVPDGLKLYLVDSSPSIIEEARRQVGDRAAAYHVAPAEEMAALIPDKVDRVLCNMSFWYFRDPDAVLGQLRQVLKPTGRLCFNLSGTYFNTYGGVVSPQWALVRALHGRGEVARPINEPDRLPNQRSIESTLMAARFKPFHFSVQEIPGEAPETEPGGELYSLLQLYPVLGGADHREAVAKSLAVLPEVAGAIAAYQPRWRAAHFMAQPAISPDEALMARFGGKLPQ